VASIEVENTLHDSVEAMLSPENLSELLGRPVTDVDRGDAAVWGNAGSQFTPVDTDAGRLILKTMSMDSDWEMFATDDTACRSVMTWQYGLLDRARPHLDAAVLACAREGDLWAILMPDLSGRFLRDTPQNSPSPQMREMLPRFLDGMAGMHAEFWEDPTLDDPRLGLNDPRGLLQFTSPTFVRQHLGKWDTWLLAGAVDGWVALQEALDDDAAAQARALIDDPQPLLEALARHPSTFLHGDLYEPNLARNGDHLIAVDWQLALHSVATIDLARLVLEACEDAASQARAVQHYRDRLEVHLGSRLPDDQWEEMVDLGILTEVLWIRPFLAWIASVSDDAAWVAKLTRQVDAANEQIRNGVRWLS
jgi:hypothetical protein